VQRRRCGRHRHPPATAVEPERLGYRAGNRRDRRDGVPGRGVLDRGRQDPPQPGGRRRFHRCGLGRFQGQDRPRCLLDRVSGLDAVRVRRVRRRRRSCQGVPGGLRRHHRRALELAPAADRKVNAIVFTADGSRLVVGGPFLHTNGAAQPYVAAVSPATGALLPWAGHTAYAGVALAADQTGVYEAGAGNGGNIVGYNPATGAIRWVGGMDGNVQAVAAMEGVVYVGGHFVRPGRLERHPDRRRRLHESRRRRPAGVRRTARDHGPTLTDAAGGMWTNAAAVSVSASATIDAAPGFDGYRYQTSGDGGAIWGALRSGSPATVKAEGVTLVRYEAVDLYGNASLWADGVVRIDRTAPTVPLAAGGNGSTSAPARPPTRSPRQVPRTPDRASPVTSTRRRPTAARPGRARRPVRATRRSTPSVMPPWSSASRRSMLPGTRPPGRCRGRLRQSRSAKTARDRSGGITAWRRGRLLPAPGAAGE